MASTLAKDAPVSRAVDRAGHIAQPWADCITNMPGFNLRQAQGVNRRRLFQTLAARAAVSGVIGSPALAEAKSSTSLP